MGLRVFKINVIFTLLLFFAAPSSFAGVLTSEEALAFASFIKGLTSTTQIAKEGSICSFGNDEISKIIASQNQDYISLDSDPKQYKLCRVIYIAQGMQKGLGVELAKFNKNNIMTIAIFEGFVEFGGMVQVQMGRRNFELILNTKKIKASGIRLSALVLSLVIN